MREIKLTLAQAATMYEDHFKVDMDPKQPYEDAARMVLNDTGEAEFLRRLSYLTDTGTWIKDDPGRRAKRAKKTALETVPGNAPECPNCGSWNALLDDYEGEPDYRQLFKCRDCGFKVFKDECIVTVKTLDKPGMGNRSTYTQSHCIKGENY